MTQAKKKGLFAFLLALLASAIVSGALLLSPATANAATGESEGNVITVDSGEIAALQTALVQAQPGDTVRLTQNITLDLTAYDPDLMGQEGINGHMVIGSKAELGDYGVNDGVILDLAGHTLAVNTNSYYTCLLIQGVDFTVTDSVGGGRLAGTSNGVFATADASSEITLENVTVEYTYGTEGYFAGQTSDEAAIVTDGALTLDNVDFALAGVSNTATTSSGEAVEGAVESVAKVGDTYYTDVKTAIESATDGQTVTLTDNATLSGVTYVRSEGVILDLGNYTLTIPEGFDDKVYDDEGKIIGAGIAVKVYGSLTLAGGENGRIDAAEAPETTNPFAAQNGGAITVNSGTIEVDTNSEACIYAFQGGFVTINGGTLINRATGDYTWGGEEVLVVNAASNATTPASTMVRVNGGTFIGRNPAFGDDAIGGTFITEEVKTVTYTLDGQTYIMVYDTAEPALPEGAVAIGGDYFEGETLVNEVNSAAALSSVLGNVADEAYIRLGASFKADVVIPEGKTVTLDLNGKTLTNVNGHTILNYGTLIITDTLDGGTVDNVTHARAAVYNEYGGDVTILGGTFRRSAEASTSYTNNGGNSYYVIANEGDMVIGSADEDCGIIVYTGNSYEASMHTHMYSALVNTLTYDSSQESHLTIYDGEFYGGNIAIKGDTWSTLAIRGGTISAGNQAVQTWEETEISGGEFNGRVIGWADENGNSATLEITDGTFNGTIETLLFANDGNTYNTDEIETSVSGGEFAKAIPESYIAENSLFYPEGEGYKVEEYSAARLESVLSGNENYVAMGNKVFETAAEAAEEGAVAVTGQVAYANLQDAIDAAEAGATVTLIDDYDNTVNITIDKSLILDGNGKTITTTVKKTVLVIRGSSAGNEVTVKNLKIVSNENAAMAFHVSTDNVDVSLENVEVDFTGATGNTQAVTVAAGNNINIDIIDSNLHANENGYAIIMLDEATVTVKDSEVNAWAAAYFKNTGAEDSSGSNVTFDNCTILTQSPEVDKHYSFGTFVFENVSNVTLDVRNCDITAIRGENSEDVQLQNVIRLATSGTDNGITLENNAITLDEEYPSFVYDLKPDSSDSVKVVSGTFSQPVDISEYLAEGVVFFPNEDGTYSVGGETAAIAAGMTAVIGKVAYATLEEAVAAVPADGVQVTITLIGGENGVITGNGVKFNDGQNIVIDFNGKTYNVDKTVGSAGTETNGFQLLKGSVVTLKNGAMTSDTALILLQNYCNLTLDGMTLNLSDKQQKQYVISNNFGNTVITGDTKIIAPEGGVAFDVFYGLSETYYDGVSVTFDENFTGKVEGTVEYGAQVANENWQDKSKLTIENGNFDITFDVYTGDATEANITANGGNFGFVLPEEYLGEGASLYTDGEGGYAVAPANEAPEGMNKVAVTVNGKGYSSIAAALEATEGEVEIKLYDDLVENVVIPAGKTVVLDLAGFTITNVSDHTIVNYGNLTIQGEGVVDNITHARGALFNLGTATLLGGEYTRSLENSSTNSWYAIKNLGHLTIGAEGEECSVQVIQDGNFSSLITNGYYDADGKAGGDYDMYYGLVTTDDKLPTLTINGGTFRGGINTVKNDNHSVATINGGEFLNTTQATVLNWNELTINGGTFNADSNALYAVITSYDGSTGYNNGTTAITGGTFNGGLLADVNAAEVTYEISGGTFDTAVPEDFLAEDFVLNYNAEDGTFAPVEKIAFAHVERGGKIYSFAQPDQAIAFAEEGETVVLDVSFKIPGSLVINKSINLDLNGQTITGTVSGKATLQINGLEEGKSFDVNIFSSVEGAKIVSEKSLALWALHDANVTVTGITVEGFGTAIQVGIANSARTASLTVNDCEVIATSEDINDVPAGIFVVGNVTKANAEDYGTLQPVTLIVNDSHITGYAYGVVGNGLNHNTYIELNNTDIDGYMADGGMSIYSTGIFHPQNGTMIVNGGSIIAENAAIEIRSGNLTIKGDAVLTATSKEFAVQSAADGTTVMGVALGISQHTTNLDINVNIESGTFNGVKSVYEEDFQDDLSENISVNITGGEFNGAVESKNVKGFITGGRFAELPAEDAFAEGLEGELYNGYYVVVNASEAGTAATIADRLAAQNDLRAYLAAFGLTLADMEAAESDEFAAAVTAAYEEIFLANTKDDIATALAAAMDAVDAYRANLAAEKAAALTELTEYAMGAQGGDLAIVVVPTYAISAINAAVTADEIETYVSLAKAEMDDIRAQRAEAEQQYQAVNDRFDAIMQALGITGSAEEGYTSEVLDKLNGVIEALGITEADGAWSTDLLDGITRDLETANENIAAMQDLLGTAADEATAQTVIGMIKATQNSVAAAETNIKNAISTLSADINSKYDTLIAAVNGLPAADTFEQLSGTVSELAGKVDAMNTAVSGFETTVTDRLNGIDEAIGGLTEAQNALTEAVNGYKAAVDSTLADFNAKFAELSAKVDELPTSDELKQSLTDALSLVHSKLDAIKTETDKIDGLHDSITTTVSEDIAAAFNEFEETFTGAMNGINTKLDSLDSAIAALPDDADITALKEAVQAATAAAKEAGTKVDTLGTTLSGRFDSVDSAITSIDDAIDGLTAAQNAMNEAMTAFRSELNTTLSGVNEAIAAVKADVKALADTAAADKVELLEKLNALQTSADAIEQAIASLDGDSSADLSAISAELAALQTSLGDVADVVDEVALGNTNSSSSFAGIYVYLSAILVLAAVILIVLAVKKRR